MRRLSSSPLASRGSNLGLALGLVVLCGLLAAPVGAVGLTSGEFSLNLDTTVSWGMRYRLSNPDLDIVGVPSGGNAWSVNGDDGNLNFKKGLTSNAIKATIDLDMRYKNVGAFFRGSAFYDYEIEENCCERTQLGPEALDRVGSRAEFLDAFVWWQFNLGDRGGQLRVGDQVLNWGESTFIQGGINVLNPVDVSALRVPGAELREALLPEGILFGSFDLSQTLSLEAYYQYDWEETIIDPPGSYFSTNDFAGRGGETVFLGFGSFPDSGDSPSFVQPPVDHPFLGVGRAPTVKASNGDQYGVALRWLVPKLADTEFGFYYTKYHSRLPTVNAITGTVQGAIDAQVAAGGVYRLFGVPPGESPLVDSLATAAATDAYAATARYFIAYPEDIKLYGMSFNAQVGTTGVALQGEVAYRQDAPYQVDDVELLFAALSPISPGLAATNQVVPGGAGFKEVILGYRLHDSLQVGLTATKVFGPVMGADTGLLLLEGAYDYVADMPSKDVLRYEGPGTYTSGNPIHAGPGGAHAGKDYEPADQFADPNSWGYRLVGRLTYNNALGAFNLSPRFGWQHDVSGISPGPGGNFIEGRKALTIGLGADYQSTWQFDLSYTMYSGAGRYNLINDRDFAAANVKFSF